MIKEGDCFYIKKEFLRKGDHPNGMWFSLCNEKNGFVTIQRTEYGVRENRRIDINHIVAIDLYWDKGMKKIREQYS